MRATQATGLAAGLMIAASLAATTPAAAEETSHSSAATPTSQERVVVVDSQAGWVAVPISPDQGYWVSAIGGSWTVDHRSVPYTRASGYQSSDDRKIWHDCKIMNQTYGTLIGRIGPNGNPFVIGNSHRVRGDATGVVYLRINDADQCLGDNAGTITVRIR